MSHRTRTPRRGGVIAVVVLLIALINVVALGVLDVNASEVRAASLRIESARALYAGESALMGVARLRRAGLPLPAQGASLNLPHASATYLQVPTDDATSGSVRVRGVSGEGQRRLTLQFEVQ